MSPSMATSVNGFREPSAIRMEITWSPDAPKWIGESVRPALAWVFRNAQSEVPVSAQMFGAETHFYLNGDRPTVELRSPWPLRYGPYTPDYDRGTADEFYVDSAIPAARFLRDQVFPDGGAIMLGPPSLNPPDSVGRHPVATGALHGHVAFRDGRAIPFWMSTGGGDRQHVWIELRCKGELESRIATAVRDLSARMNSGEDGLSVSRRSDPDGVVVQISYFTDRPLPSLAKRLKPTAPKT